jgi:hypothetical protein
MAFDRFVASLQTPALVDIANHWNSARGTREMPAWRDIDPAAIRRHLSIIWAWRYDPEEMTFIGRLAGQAIIGAIGCQIRGRRIEDCFLPNAAPIIRERLDFLLARPRLMRSTGSVYLNSGRHGVGERISLPLSDGGSHPDGIFGATAYLLNYPVPRDQRLELEAAQEEVEFFDLRA